MTVNDIELLIIGVDIPGTMHFNFKSLFENGDIVVILKTKVAVNAVPEYITDT